MCVCVCVCVCVRERERRRRRGREVTLCVAKTRSIYFFKRSINKVHAKTEAKGRGSPVLPIEASQRK